KWLEVVNWFREAMLPNGIATTRATLDTLKTRRPILVMSSFGHTALVNTRALQLANITARTPDPLGGRIDRDPSGTPSGILEGARLHRRHAEALLRQCGYGRGATLGAGEESRTRGVLPGVSASGAAHRGRPRRVGAAHARGR